MKKHYNIEFLRFFFSILIVLYHLLHANIMPYVGEHAVYLKMQGMTEWSSLMVECFLIMGGYFLYVSYERAPEKPFMEYAVNRFVRLWPVFAFYTLCTLLLGGKISEDTLLDLAFLRCTGISLSYKGIIWYIAPFFWSSLLIFAILKYCRHGVSGILIALICYFGYAINLNNTDGKLGRYVVYGFLSLGFLRVLAGMCLGCLIGMAVSSSRGILSHSRTPFRCFVVSCAEIGSFLALLLLFLTNAFQVKNAFSGIILFSILFLCFLSEEGILSRLLNRRIFAWFGKYAYAIYVMQQVSFYILARTFWKNTSFLCEHVVSTILISLAFCVLVGFVTYHLIEKPAVTLFKKWESRNQAAVLSPE